MYGVKVDGSIILEHTALNSRFNFQNFVANSIKMASDKALDKSTEATTVKTVAKVEQFSSTGKEVGIQMMACSNAEEWDDITRVVNHL